jgi:hypothetical protein
MALRTKFNMVLLCAFALGLVLSGGFSYRTINESAHHEIAHETTIMITAASAIRDYTAKEINPLLIAQLKVRFLPHVLSSWAAAQSNLHEISAGGGAKAPPLLDCLPTHRSLTRGRYKICSAFKILGPSRSHIG